MEKKIISTTNAPSAIGPYSQGTIFGNLVFLSGQIALDKDTGALVEGGVEEQTHMVFRNIKALLDSQGLDFSNVIKATVFLKDMNDFAKVNEIYATYFTDNYPSRSAVQVAALPKAALVEIEVIAHFNA